MDKEFDGYKPGLKKDTKTAVCTSSPDITEERKIDSTQNMSKMSVGKPRVTF